MHRPTFHNAIGGEQQGGNFLTGRTTKVGARDLPGQRSMKYRQMPPKPLYEEEETICPEIANSLMLIRKLKEKQLESVDASTIDIKALPPQINPFPEDADDGDEEAAADSSDSASSDEEAALERELAQVRAEQAAAAARKEAEREKNEELERREAALMANPLVMPVERSGRHWCDDVVFKNQALNKPQPVKRFVNDSVRSDFHRRFLAKYIQ